MFNKKMQYIIRTCSSENVQELQNLLNEMSMNGWELYSMNEVETDDGFQYNCIFMTELKTDGDNANNDVINITTFKSQMEKMLMPQLSPYESCIDIQSKIKNQLAQIAKVKKDLEGEVPASSGRKKLNDKISAGIKELEELKQKLAKTTSPDVMYSKLHEDKLAIHLSEELLEYVDSDKNIREEELVAETVKVRLKLTEELGYVMPKIVFRDDENLNSFEFCIKIRGYDAFKSLVYPDYAMFFESELHLEKKIKNSIYDIDPITGKKIVWIEKDKTKDFWTKGLSGAEYIARALEFAAVRNVEDLLDYSDIDKYVDVVNEKNQYLVENLIPDFISLSDLKYILVNLIREQISIKDITYIFEKLNDYAEDSAKADLLKKIRLALSKQICRKNINTDGAISIFEISDKTLDTFIPSFDEDNDYIVKIDGEFAARLAGKIIKKAESLGIDNPKILVPLEYRHLFFTLLSHYMNNITVLAREEIGCYCPIDVISVI